MLTDAQVNEIRVKLEAEAARLRASGEAGLRLAVVRERTAGDDVDVASAEGLFSTDMRLRDREKFLLDEVRAAFCRLDAGEIDECLSCGGSIGFRRLLARPVATLCVECKEAAERREWERAEGAPGDFGFES